MNRNRLIQNVKRQIVREIFKIMYENKKVTLDKLHKEFDVYEPGDQDIVSIVYSEILDGYHDLDKRGILKTKEDT